MKTYLETTKAGVLKFFRPRPKSEFSVILRPKPHTIKIMYFQYLHAMFTGMYNVDSADNSCTQLGSMKHLSHTRFPIGMHYFTLRSYLYCICTIQIGRNCAGAGHFNKRAIPFPRFWSTSDRHLSPPVCFAPHFSQPYAGRDFMSSCVPAQTADGNGL